MRKPALCVRKKPQALHCSRTSPGPPGRRKGRTRRGSPPPLPFPLCLLDGPSRSAPLHIRWDRAGRAAEPGGRAERPAGCSTPAAPLSLSTAASQHGSPHNPPNPQPESSARSAAPCAHSLPTHSRTPEAVGGRKANRCPPRPSPSPTSPRDAPSPLCKSGRLAPLLGAPSSRTHRAASSSPRPAPAARRWVKP